MLADHLMLEYLAFISNKPIVELPEEGFAAGFLKSHFTITEFFGISLRIFKSQFSDELSNYCLGINFGFHSANALLAVARIVSLSLKLDQET